MSKFETLARAHEGEEVTYKDRVYNIGRYEYIFPLLPRVWLTKKGKEICSVNEEEFLRLIEQ